MARIGKTTLYGWLKEPSFVVALENARQEQSREALGLLRTSLLLAVRKLNDLLQSQSEAVAYRAAVTLLDHGLKAVEIVELEARIAALENPDETDT
jgi:hypothetical protein